MSRKISILILTLCTCYSWGQEQVLVNTKEVIDEIGNVLGTEYDLSQQYDDLEYLATNPIDLNAVEREADFELLFFLDASQVSNLLRYLKEHGSLYSLAELKYIAGFDSRTVRWMLPFVRIGEGQQKDREVLLPLKQLMKYANHRLLLSSARFLEGQRGYSRQDHIGAIPYAGDVWKHQLKYRMRATKQVEFGVSIEKDRGEAYWQRDYGPDFYSAYLQLNNLGAMTKAVLGSYHLRFGQGLVFWTGSFMSKTSEVLQVKKSSDMLKRYSSGEGNFLQGVATQWDLGRGLDLVCMASYRQLSASLEESDSLSYIKSFKVDGLHRTDLELSRRNVVGHYVFGTALQYHVDGLQLGLLGSVYGYDRPYQFSRGEEQQYVQTFHNVGLSVEYRVKEALFYGEYALDYAANMAMITGVMWYPASRFKGLVTHRYYSPYYYAHYAGGISEGGHIRNEQGVYFGIEFLPVKRWKFSAYSDLFYFEGSSYGVSKLGASGYEVMGQLEFFPQDQTELTLRYKYESKERDAELDMPGIAPTVDQTKASIRVQLVHQVYPSLKLQTRLESSIYKKDLVSEQGYLLSQDIIWDIRRLKARCYLRYAYCDAPDYNNRFFVYENDVLYAFSIPAYYGQASRYYFLMKVSPLQNLSCWLKLGQTHFYDREQISSGYEQMEGQRKTELKLQLQWTF